MNRLGRKREDGLKTAAKVVLITMKSLNLSLLKKRIDGVFSGQNLYNRSSGNNLRSW
jgi:hypothetical protein